LPQDATIHGNGDWHIKVYIVTQSERRADPAANSIKPLLIEENKIVRLKYALSMLEPSSSTFQAMYDDVYVDKKWFYMTQINSRYYLFNGKREPLRLCKSKRFVEKVMFLAAVAHSKYNVDLQQMFTGKIGIWPFVMKEPTQRSSKN
jgi:hypothetical protein